VRVFAGAEPAPPRTLPRVEVGVENTLPRSSREPADKGPCTLTRDPVPGVPAPAPPSSSPPDQKNQTRTVTCWHRGGPVHGVHYHTETHHALQKQFIRGKPKTHP
jgi:hypothetical protein